MQLETDRERRGGDWREGARSRTRDRFNVRTEGCVQMKPVTPAIRMVKRHKCRAPAAVQLHGFGLRKALAVENSARPFPLPMNRSFLDANLCPTWDKDLSSRFRGSKREPWLGEFSPRPSPLGRGRIGSNPLANPRLASARRLPNFKKMDNGCSLSQRERVRVRENATVNHQTPASRKARFCGDTIFETAKARRA